VYYVPDLKSNILSMGQLMGKGLLSFNERSSTRLKGQTWTFDCSRRDEEKPDV